MATLSSHTLNGSDGTHAGGVAVALYRINADQSRTLVFDSQMDAGGRLQQSFELTAEDCECPHELVFQSGAYFMERGTIKTGAPRVEEIVLRFKMPDPDGKYHMPVILNPNSYSTWWSA